MNVIDAMRTRLYESYKEEWIEKHCNLDYLCFRDWMDYCYSNESYLIQNVNKGTFKYIKENDPIYKCLTEIAERKKRNEQQA